MRKVPNLVMLGKWLVACHQEKKKACPRSIRIIVCQINKWRNAYLRYAIKHFLGEDKKYSHCIQLMFNDDTSKGIMIAFVRHHN